MPLLFLTTLVVVGLVVLSSSLLVGIGVLVLVPSPPLAAVVPYLDDATCRLPATMTFFWLEQEERELSGVGAAAVRQQQETQIKLILQKSKKGKK